MRTEGIRITTLDIRRVRGGSCTVCTGSCRSFVSGVSTPVTEKGVGEDEVEIEVGLGQGIDGGGGFHVRRVRPPTHAIRVEVDTDGRGKEGVGAQRLHGGGILIVAMVVGATQSVTPRFGATVMGAQGLMFHMGMTTGMGMIGDDMEPAGVVDSRRHQDWGRMRRPSIFAWRRTRRGCRDRRRGRRDGCSGSIGR